ncbi:hypothetical protein BDQ17DRAFT_479030 [Cyathus striatus]|nr:hypothetical protein BDQ17DRAFT_479030 [Cyathus striatus]
MSSSESQSTNKSDKFNKSDADVIFQSSDGVLFALHKKNLAIYTGGFPETDTTEADEVIIPLEEKSEILELLFQFVYPPDFPSLAGVPSEVFIQLAHAAEKYMVYIAMPACRARMLFVMQHCAALYTRKNRKGEDLKAIVKYALDHYYMEIIDELTPFLVVLPLKMTIYLFPVQLQTDWGSVDGCVSGSMFYAFNT